MTGLLQVLVRPLEAAWWDYSACTGSNASPGDTLECGRQSSFSTEKRTLIASRPTVTFGSPLRLR